MNNPELLILNNHQNDYSNVSTNNLSPEYFKQNFKFFLWNNEPDVSEIPPYTNFAFAVQSIHYLFWSQSLVIRQQHFIVLMEVSKNGLEAVRRMIIRYFIVTCLLFSFKYLIIEGSKNIYQDHWWKNWNWKLKAWPWRSFCLKKNAAKRLSFDDSIHSKSSRPNKQCNHKLFHWKLKWDITADFSKIIDLKVSGYCRLDFHQMFCLPKL